MSKSFVKIVDRVRPIFWLLVLLVMSCHPAAAAPQKMDRLGSLHAITSSASEYSIEKRAEKCLELLKQEMATPSDPMMDLSGGPIDTGYIQNAIIGSFYDFNASSAQSNDLMRLRRWAIQKLQQEGTTNKGLHDRLILVIGHTGDRLVVPQLIDILKTSPEGYLRSEAAMALYDTQDRFSIPALKHALETDTYARFRTGSCFEPCTLTESIYSPVRDAAARALKRMGVSVPKGAEILDRKYFIPRLEPFLYSNDQPTAIICLLSSIGGPDAEEALQRFIDSKKNDPKSSGFAKFAQDMLDKTKIDRPYK
jgi:hypothetical protein